jgi:hypothetical protein
MQAQRFSLLAITEPVFVNLFREPRNPRGVAGINITQYTASIFNMADFTHFWNTKIDGLFFTSPASFHILGKLKIGNLFTDAKCWAGIYKLSALRNSRLGLRTLF